MAPLPAANRVTPGPATARSSWLSRRYAGLPLLVWLASGLLLAVPLLAGGWMWLGRSGQQDPGDDVVEVTDVTVDTDASAVEEPIAKPKPTPDAKKKLPPKPARRPPPGKNPAKPTG